MDSVGNEENRRFSWRDAVLLAVIAAGALLLRTHHLASESVWEDEYLSAAYLNAPSFLDFWHEQSPENWDPVPVYYVFQYFWARCFSDPVFAVRWLSVLFGLAAIPFVYAMGRRLSGRLTAVTSSLCLALSPLCIYHSQGIRPYSLLLLLGVISAHAFTEILHSNKRRWWLVTGAANVLMMWTHPFGVFLLGTEALFLFVFRFGQFWRTAVWFVPQAVSVFCLAAWMHVSRVVPPTGDTLPVLKELSNQLFQRDATYLWWSLGRGNVPFVGDAPAWLLVALTWLPRWNDTVIDVFKAVSVAAVLWVFWLWVRARFRFQVVTQTWIFLLLWFMAPVLFSYAFAYVGNPSTFQERYTFYAAPALYLLAGGVVAIPKARILRACGGVGLVLLIAGYTVVSVPVPMRTDYLGVARWVQAKSGPRDTVLAYPYGCMRTLTFNMRGDTRPVECAASMPELFEKIDTCLDAGNAVWLVYQVGYGGGPELAVCERYLAARGISDGKKLFPGMTKLAVFQCRPGSGYMNSSSPESVDRLRQDLAVKGEQQTLHLRVAALLRQSGRAEEAAGEYKRLVEGNPDDADTRLRWAEALEASGQREEALAQYAKASELDPVRGVSAWGNCLLHAQQPARAREVFRDALAKKQTVATEIGLRVSLAQMLEGLGEKEVALEEYGNASRLATAHHESWIVTLYANALRDAGRFDEAIQAYRKATALNPADGAAQAGLGLALREKGLIAESVFALESAHRLGVGDPGALIGLASSLAELGRVQEVLPLVEECRRRGITLPGELLRRMTPDAEGRKRGS